LSAMTAATPWQRINVLVPAAYRTANAKFGIEMTNAWGTNDIFIDDFSVEEFIPTTITSAATGNWSDATTWVGGVVPNANNHVVITAGHTVSTNVNIARCQNVTVDGTFQYGTTTTQFNHILGDLTVNSGGVYNSFSGTTGKRTMFGGSIINNGTINFSVGAGNLVWVGGAPATYSGTGSISSFVSNSWHANSGGVTYNAPVEIRNVMGLYIGAVNPNGNLTAGNILVTAQTVERTSIGYFTQAPIWTAGITRNVSYITANLSPTTKTTYSTGHDFPVVSGVGVLGGTLAMSTHDNVQLSVPVEVGTATTGVLTLTRGILITSDVNSLTLNSFIAGPAGTAPSILTPPTTHGSYVVGPLRINFPTTTFASRNFALGVGTDFNGTTPNSNILKTVTFASTVAWADVALRVRIAGAPSGTANSPLVSVMGTRAYQVERIGTADLPATATIAIRGNNYTFGNSDNLIGDRPEIRVAQANSLTGPWTERSLTTGTGAIVDNTTYTYTTAATAPGPIAPLATNGGFFAFATLYSAPLPAVFTFAPNQFPFSNVNIGSTSPDQTFTMSNTGGLPLSVTSVAKTGADAAEFVLTDANTYPLTLAAAASATYTVAFKPTSAGAKIASISMITSVGTYEVSLTGTGVEPPPTLPMPRNLTAIATPNTVQLNWQEPNLSGVTYEDFFEGFEAGILPTGWVIYDADGDTYNWEVFSIPASWPPHSGNGIIASASWMSTTGPLTPNNWLVTPPIQVSNESQLKFWVAGQDPAWAAEKYYVRISTTGNAVANFTTTLHTGISTGTWQEIVVNLSAYGGQTVYLAFVHADITDMFYIKLDDILVTNTVTTAAYTPFVANNNIPEYSFKTAGMTKAAINARLGQIYQSMVASQGLAAELDEGTGPVLVTPQGSKSLATRDVLYDNGPFINAPGQGPNGADGSVLQSSLGMTTYGPSVNYAATPVPIRVADDFEVTGNWNVETFTFYGYQTSTTHANPPLTSFTSGRLQIWDGDPANPASQVVWGDMTINRMVSTSWSGAYRYTETTVNNQRPIMAVVCETPGLTLQPGTYWVEFAMTGTIASGPWGVPITINGQTSTGNAQQYTGTTNAWAPLLMGGTSTPYGLPFLIGGTVGGGSDYNLLGYNVYRNGVQLANTISALTYLDTPVAAGTYTYGVTAVYGAPTPGESDPIEIDVTVSATAGIFPLLETFTNTLFPPEDWMVYDADGAGTIWVRSTAQNHTTGGGGSAFHNYAVASAGLQKGWLVSPLVSIPPAINAELTFWSYNSFPTDYGNNSVMVSTTTQSPATGNYVQVWTTASVTTAWVKTVVDLSSFAGQDIYFGFHYQGEYAHGWYLDDVSVDPRYPKDLAATKVTGPGNPTSGTASTYKVFVKNLGTAAQSTYTVSLFKEGGVLVGALPGVAIDPDQELSFDIPWTPGTAGNTFLYGVVDLAGDQLLANNTSPNLNVEVMPVGTVVVTIGTGTTFPTTAIRVPFDFYYKNNLAQSIYYADEIGPIGGFLKGITYYNSFVTNLPDKNVKIWVGTTTWDNLNAGWVAPASLTLMYDGTVNFPSGSNSIYIPFATPFVYMGGNLVVYTNRVWENFYFNSGDRFFLTQTTNKPARTRHVSADATVYDPATPPTPAASQLKDWHPNTTLFFQLAYGSVQGIVKDAASGNPILGAQVSMGNQSFVTLANGAFAFNDVSIGNYTLSAQKPGYATVTKQITIPANQTITEDLALTKDIVVPGAMIAVLNPSETSVVLKWGLPNGAYEIIYDDGVAETHAVWALGGNMNALRFTPASYPADILRGSVNIGNGLFPVGTVLTPFQMAVFDDDGPNGFPGTQLGVVSVTPTKYGWVNFNLSSLNLTIASGDFYLVMIQGGNSPNCVPIAVNQTNPVMRSYSRLVTGGGAWAIAGVNDFMIRAVVQSPGGMPGLALSPPYFVDYAKPQAGMLFEHNPISASGFVGEATYSPIEGTGEQFRNLLGYRIFRLSEGQENDEASWLMIGNPSNTVFVDNAWPTLPDGSYRWAVKARYTGGSFSGAVLSNILRKNFLSNVTVKVTLSDPAASPAGTKVTLTNNAFAQYNYAATAGANGTVNFPSVVKGAYTLNVLLDNYDPHTAQVNIIANTMTINVNLLETTYPPSNLVVNPITLVATWDQASPPFPEVIVNFNNGMPQGWTVISNGTAPDFKWQVIPDLGGSSLNGTPFAIANSDAAPSTALLDEYLISPVMNVASQPTVFLEFDQYYRHLGTGSYGQVDVWNGTA
ncbi:MAG: choice-of-anchor J domain-containing protein, partial [Bacteroidales bacterium]|nr:choice-of-anchor J domain-containing protein [Bacteroidales bacterium]